MKKEPTDGNQGEGDKFSSRKYTNDLRDFISTGKVNKAASDARAYVERDPEDAARAEREAKRGPAKPIDELVAMGRNLVERVKRAFRRPQKK